MTLLDAADRAWFARAQGLYFPLQAAGRISTFGEYPGSGKPYGFLAHGVGGDVCTVLNPGATTADVPLPVLPGAARRLLFTDAGCVPVLAGGAVRLGPGQLAVVGSGSYAHPRWNLGLQDDVQIPASSEPLATSDVVTGPASVSATVLAPQSGLLRIMCSQSGADGRPWRVSGGAPPSGTPMGKLLVVRAEQGGRELGVSLDYDLQIWSGLSWAVADVSPRGLAPGSPVRITYTVSDPKGKSGLASIRAFAVGDADATR
jgi:hypothetical protein